MFHYISDIPAAPAAYIAHPYTLLQTRRLVGRQAEVSLLTDWVAGKTRGFGNPRGWIFNLVAIGGMGKTAWTWKWFNEIAPTGNEAGGRAAPWSFYECVATFENFVFRPLAYVTGRAREDVQKTPFPATERRSCWRRWTDRRSCWCWTGWSASWSRMRAGRGAAGG